MTHVYIEDIADHVEKEVTLKGWLYNKTDKGKLRFLMIRDGTGMIQAVVFQKNVSPEVFQATDTLTQESSLVVTGKIKQEERAVGGFEMDVSHLEAMQVAETYPITPKEHGTSFLMDNRHLWLRSARQHSILRVRSEIIKACRNFL
ncbi:MAG: OB-fold nucleic acid binding domain-containing protein, partial [Acidobacteria bacterium]|nr:OB-fold nucleic acid binding domain-containing protein [Acidobacteriota bacterium]